MQHRVRHTLLIGIVFSCLHTTAYSDSTLSSDSLYLDALKSIKEKRSADARITLSRMIAQEPEHAGAWLDLAIIHCELGHTEEAEKLFHEIEIRFSPPQAILDVITQYRQTGCHNWIPNKKIFLSVDRGNDSNVNQGASNPNFIFGSGNTQIEWQLLPEYLPQKDKFSSLSVDYIQDINSNGDLGFAQFRVRENDNLRKFNTTVITIGAERPLYFGDWKVRGTAMAGLLGLDSKLYQKQFILQTRITPPLPLNERYQFSLLTGVTHAQYPTLTDYNSTTWDTRGILTYQTDLLQIQSSAGLMLDHGSSLRQGGDRKGWMANLQARMRLRGDIIGTLGWGTQNWRSSSSYSPGLIDDIRTQRTQVVQASVNMPINQNHALQFDVKNVRNHENISLLQYNGVQFQLSWQWQNN